MNYNSQKHIYVINDERSKIITDGDKVHISFQAYTKFLALLRTKNIGIAKSKKIFYIVPTKHTRPYIIWHLTKMQNLGLQIDYKNQLYYKEI